mgnify:CR=1 FL=1
MDLELRGKNVLVTGASKGIGLACARAFAAEGCNVHIAARSAAELEKNAAELSAQYKVKVTPHAHDLAVSENTVKLARECGPLDVLVNNAGAIPGGHLADIDEARWRKAWELKVFGYINLTREVYADMRARGSGVIVNVIGLAGERNRPEYIAGTAGNASLMAFTRALGAESVDYGVRVVGINPGAIATGENLFSTQDVRNLALFGGLRPDRDILQMDIPQSYGMVQFSRTLSMLREHGWSPQQVFPHAGNLMTLAAVAGFGLGGCEAYPGVFGIFAGFADDAQVSDGMITLSSRPGIGFEGQNALFKVMNEIF